MRRFRSSIQATVVIAIVSEADRGRVGYELPIPNLIHVTDFLPFICFASLPRAPAPKQPTCAGRRVSDGGLRGEERARGLRPGRTAAQWGGSPPLLALVVFLGCVFCEGRTRLYMERE